MTRPEPRATLAAVMRPARWLAGLAMLVMALNGRLPVFAQEPATAVVTSPLPGETLAGVVVIRGTAAAAPLLRYEVAFGYENDFTGAWFSLAASNTPVRNGRLAIWDTRAITPGLYVLRVRVYTSEREYVETLVRGVRVRETAEPEPTATPAAPEAAPSATPPAPEPTLTAPVIALLPASTPPPTSARGEDRNLPADANLSAGAARAAFGAGVRFTFFIFSLLGVYLGLRAIVLAWWRRRPQR